MQKNIIVILGPQGSGKGTQAKILSKEFNLPHISAGDLIRDAEKEGGEISQKISDTMNRGELIPDEIAIDLIKNRVLKDDCECGFILDGFPRTINQVQLLGDFLEVTKVIEIYISEEESIKRLTNRRQCSGCGAIYNLYTDPKPKKDELCDKCKIKLKKRKDDREEAIKARLAVYKEETEPVLEHYKDKVVRIEGEQKIEKVAADIEISIIGILNACQ